MKVNENKGLKLLIFSILYIILLNETYAFTEKTNYTIYEDADRNSINLGIALLNGESEELVYKNGEKLSELTWEFENVPMIGLEMKTKLTRKIYFNASA